MSPSFSRVNVLYPGAQLSTLAMVSSSPNIRSSILNPIILWSVQRVYAIGEPPKDKTCFFRHLKNVVVLPGAGAFPCSLRILCCNNPCSQVGGPWRPALVAATWMGS